MQYPELRTVKQYVLTLLDLIRSLHRFRDDNFFKVLLVLPGIDKEKA